MKASTVHVYCDKPVEVDIRSYGLKDSYSLSFQDEDINTVVVIGLTRDALEEAAVLILSYFEDCDRTAAAEDARRLAEAQRQAAKYMGEDGDGGNPDDRPEEA